MARASEQDHVDRFLASLGDKVPELDFAVEGIVDRIMGLSQRLKHSMEDTLTRFGLNYGEWKVLGSLVHAGPPHRRSPGWLSERHGLSSGAMTNRLDQLEKAGFVRRLPDPDDRRGLQIELTDEGMQVWRDAAGTQAVKEALIASALTDREKEQLNALLRRLMLEFERREGADPRETKKTAGSG